MKWSQLPKNEKIVVGSIGLMVLIAIIVVAVIFWPSKHIDSHQPVNVVDGVPPVSRAMESDVVSVQNALAAMPANQREAWLRTHYPHLAEGVQYYLRQERVISPDVQIDRIRFMYGSLDGVRANTGTGNNVTGMFHNKIVALVYFHGESLPRAFALQCMNGLMEVPPGYEARLQNLGDRTPNMVFTIGPREGLTKHLDYRASVDVADRFNIPMYRGKVQNAAHRISYMDARALQSETDRIQVTARVFEGDRFDLVNMTYVSAKDLARATRHVHHTRDAHRLRHPYHPHDVRRARHH
jgi:hypothetical protein